MVLVRVRVPLVPGNVCLVKALQEENGAASCPPNVAQSHPSPADRSVLPGKHVCAYVPLCGCGRGEGEGEVSGRSLLWGCRAGVPDRGIVSSARPQIVLFRVSTKT